MSALETLTITLIGFGSVNRTFAKLIAREASWLAAKHRLRVVYHAILARHGAWEAIHTTPLSCEAVSRLAEDIDRGHARLDGSRGDPPLMGVTVHKTPSTETVRAIISRHPRNGLGCVVEAIDVDYNAGEPAATFIADAISHGLHAISANKGPVVHQRASLLATAASSGVRYLHESAVMDGVPIFSAWSGGFRGARLRSFRGVLNSTTTIILSAMEDDEKTMAEALRVAQDAGIAEADPSGDLSGMDCAVKVVALAVALELPSARPFTLSDVDVSGIECVTPESIADAVKSGSRLRLVGGATAAIEPGGQARGYVRLESLRPGDPLYSLTGADSAVTLNTDKLSPVTIVSSAPTIEDTAYGEFADMLRACRPQSV